MYLPQFVCVFVRPSVCEWKKSCGWIFVSLLENGPAGGQGTVIFGWCRSRNFSCFL